LFQDKNLTCRDCGVQFVFSASEQEFFAEKGFTNEPGRCPECRAARKRATGMGGGYGAREARPLYDVVCAECGVATQVPFEPRSDRPVYCRDCFQRARASRW
jgi:CxxC-x17-CxxC domain-containing protein